MTSPGTGDPAPTPPATPPGATTPPSRSVPPAATGAPSSSAMGSQVGNILSGDWPVQAADAIVKGVDTLRDKTTGPVQKAARALVYGLMAAVLATMVGVLVIIGLVRFIDSIVGLFMDPPRIWVTYLIVGVLFTIAGYIVFRRRRADII